jgi:acyl carrier protein
MGRGLASGPSVHLPRRGWRDGARFFPGTAFTGAERNLAARATQLAKHAQPLLSLPIDRIMADGRLRLGVYMQVRTELIDFVVNNFLFGDVVRTPADDDSLVEGGVIDSTGVLELIEFLESNFGIEVSDTETLPQNLDTISNLTRFVQSKITIPEPSY